MARTLMSVPAQLRFRGRRPCLRRDVELFSGSMGLLIDAAELRWASPADLTAMAAVAAWAAPVGASRLVMPSDVDVAQYLGRMNVVSVVEEFGGTVEGPSILKDTNPLADRLIEVRQLPDSAGVQGFGSDVYRLVAAHAGSSRAYIVHTMLGELLTNTTEHARSPTGAFGAAQVHTGAKSGRAGVEVAIADTGVGILQSLRQNQAHESLPTCEEAIRASLRRGVSEVGEPNRGNGLSHVTRQLRNHGGRLVLRSGDSVARVTPSGRRFASTRTVTPGTWAWLWIDLGISASDG